MLQTIAIQHQKVAIKILQIMAVISLAGLPVMQGIAFILHYETFGEFFNFTLLKPPYTQDGEWLKIIDPEKGFRYFLLPHYWAYFTLPLYIAVALVLARTIWDKAPVLAITGSAMTATGIIYMGGVFGAWLSFTSVTALDPATGKAAFLVLTEMQGALMITTVLASLSVAGLAVLGLGLILTRAVPLWAGISFSAGNVLIVILMDRDNWMFVGSMLMLAGLLPLIRHILHDHLHVHGLEA